MGNFSNSLRSNMKNFLSISALFINSTKGAEKQQTALSFFLLAPCPGCSPHRHKAGGGVIKNFICFWRIYFFYTITMIYFSHRGANTFCVQNTAPAFELAHKQGARNFELDVHLLKDGLLAVHHDESLLSTAGQDIKLADLTSKELKQIPLKNPFSGESVFVPLLNEILPVVSPELEILNIEIKNDHNIYPGIEKVLLDMLKNYPALAPHILFSGFDYDTLARLRLLAPTARIGLLTRAFDVTKALALNAQSVHINQTRFTPDIARICHENNLRVYLYTVNDVQQAAALARDGADGIFTDAIHLFI